MNLSSSQYRELMKDPRKVAVPKPRKGSRGKACEALALRSQGLVTLDKVPNGVMYLPGGKTIPKKSLVDFIGIVRKSGRFVAFDAKECDLKGRFTVGRHESVKPAQIKLLLRYGRLGGLCGLLIESTARGRLHWLPWQMLVDLPPSYPWEKIPDIGPSNMLIDWARVFEVDLAKVGAVCS